MLRTTAATQQNDVSSRSHTVFTMSIVQYREGARPITGTAVHVQHQNLYHFCTRCFLSSLHACVPSLF